MKVIIAQMDEEDQSTLFAMTENEFHDFYTQINNCYGSEVVLRSKECNLNDNIWNQFFQDYHSDNIAIDWQKISDELKPEVFFTLAEPFEDSLYEGFEKLNRNVWSKNVTLSDLNCSKTFVANMKKSSSYESDKWLFASRCEYLKMRYRAQLAEKAKDVVQRYLINIKDPSVSFHRAALSYANQHLTVTFNLDALVNEFCSSYIGKKRADATVSDMQPFDAIVNEQIPVIEDATVEEKPKRRRRKTTSC